MGTQFKIKETQFFLNKLKDNKRKLLIATYYFSAFLTSSSSILYHLLATYNEKYELNLKNINANMFLKRAQKKKNTKALKFIKWYNSKIENLENDKTCGKLRRLRHQNVHHSLKLPSHHVMMYVHRAAPIGFMVFQPAIGRTLKEKEVGQAIKKYTEELMTKVNQQLIEKGEKPIKKIKKTIILNLSDIEYFELDAGCRKYFREIKKIVSEAETKFPLFS